MNRNFNTVNSFHSLKVDDMDIITIPDNVNEEDRKVLEALNTLLYGYKGLEALIRAKILIYNNIHWYHPIDKIRQMLSIINSKDKLNKDRLRYLMYRKSLLNHIFGVT